MSAARGASADAAPASGSVTDVGAPRPDTVTDTGFAPKFHTRTPLPFAPMKRFARQSFPTKVNPSVSTNRPSNSRSAFACWKSLMAFM